MKSISKILKETKAQSQNVKRNKLQSQILKEMKTQSQNIKRNKSQSRIYENEMRKDPTKKNTGRKKQSKKRKIKDWLVKVRK